MSRQNKLIKSTLGCDGFYLLYQNIIVFACKYACARYVKIMCDYEDGGSPLAESTHTIDRRNRKWLRKEQNGKVKNSSRSSLSQYLASVTAAYLVL